MASKDLVLITGATGHLGFKTLLLLLQAGYRARIAVRSASKQQTIVENPAFKALNLPADSYDFAIVPDITAETAYHEAIKGVTYVVHIASPLGGPEKDSTEEYHRFFVQPAVGAVLGVLKAAKQEPGVKRIVFTSSVVALISGKELMGDTKTVWDAEHRTENHDGPYDGTMDAYRASKIASLNASEKWIKKNNPHFDVVNIHPTYLEGRNELVLAPQDAFSGTNALLLVVATGNKFPRPMLATTVHNDDVARIHVDALKPSIPAGSYITDGPEMRWEQVPALMQELFPEAVKEGKLSTNGKADEIISRFDAKKTEEVFGLKFQDFKAQVKSVVGHYLELLENAPKN